MKNILPAFGFKTKRRQKLLFAPSSASHHTKSRHPTLSNCFNPHLFKSKTQTDVAINHI